MFLFNYTFLFARHNTKCNGEERKEMAEDEKNKTEILQTEDLIEDTKEFVRRSLRKQSTSTTVVESETLSIDSAQTKLSNDVGIHIQRSSRSKHHKNKTKHHKDKRKRRKHFKAENIISPLESVKRSSSDITSADEDQISFKKNNSKPDNELDIESNLKSSLHITTKTECYDKEDVMTKTENLDSIEYVENVNINKNVLYHNIEDVDMKEITMVNDSNEQSQSKLATSSITKNNNRIVIEQISNAKDTVSIINSHVQSDETKDDENNSNDMQYVNINSNCSQININTNQEIEDRKLKKKRKGKYDVKEDDDENVKEDSCEDFIDDSVYKHRKKRHKHTNEHKNRKHHDVRKAPQDGIIMQEDKNICSIIDDRTSITIGKLQSENVENQMSEPQRLAIKIKLCQECNNRHLQDACPLITPQYAISDSISYEDWLNKYKENTEVVKAVKLDDPMSEGYGKITEDNESDDESLLIEQSKTKIKNQKEEKQLTIDLDRPLYARDSLPECFELKITNSEHGLGIYAKSSVPMHVKLGPLVGQPVREMDIPDDFSMRHIWEVKSMQYLSLYI